MTMVRIRLELARDARGAAGFLRPTAAHTTQTKSAPSLPAGGAFLDRNRRGILFPDRFTDLRHRDKETRDGAGRPYADAALCLAWAALT